MDAHQRAKYKKITTVREVALHQLTSVLDLPTDKRTSFFGPPLTVLFLRVLASLLISSSILQSKEQQNNSTKYSKFKSATL